jgi:hypothetical protein
VRHVRVPERARRVRVRAQHQRPQLRRDRCRC